MQSHDPNNYYRSSRLLPKDSSKKSGKISIKWLLGFPLLVLLIMLGYHYARLSDLPFSLGKAKSSKVEAVSKPTLTAVQTSLMSSQINNVISSYQDMEVGVAIVDLNNHKSYRYGISQPFIAASISKVLTASLFLHEVELGQQTLNEDIDGSSAQYELQQLIEISDDTAWINLNNSLTNDALSNYAQQIGLRNYDPSQNTLTADDISLLLAKLYKGELLNSADTQLLMNYMHDANYDNYIVASVPKGVKVYHKIGFLDDRVHDAAIIDNGKHPYVLVIFTKMDNDGDYDDAEGHQIFASITSATVQAFL
jgi:beta-lactamase class A